MLEYVNVDLSTPKEVYRSRIHKLQQRMYELEHHIFEAKVPVMIVFEGWGASGKGKIINLLAERMDPRGFRVVPIKPPRTAETKYPWMWRFWQQIPSRGQIVAYDTSWYQRVLYDRVSKSLRQKDWDPAYNDIQEFEEMLAASGMVIMKFWLQISEPELAKRIKKLLNDDFTKWQVTESEILQLKKYDRFTQAIEDMLFRTDMPTARWTIVESNDHYYSRLKVFETIIATLEDKLNITSSIDAQHNIHTDDLQGAVNA